MVIKKWRTSKAYRFAAVAAIAVGSALIVSACNQSPTATDSVGNETAVLGQTFATKPAPKAAKAPKVDVCHLDDEGGYHLINVSGNALSAHIAHGDGQPGDGTFDEACGLVVAPPHYGLRPWGGHWHDGDSLLRSGYGNLSRRSCIRRKLRREGVLPGYELSSKC